MTFRISGPLWGESTDNMLISPHKGLVMRNFDVVIRFSLGKLLSKQYS